MDKIDNYIKADGNVIINTKYIRWIKKIDECLQICTKSDGCSDSTSSRICKIKNYDSYMKLNKLFQDTE